MLKKLRRQTKRPLPYQYLIIHEFYTIITQNVILLQQQSCNPNIIT